MLENMTTGEKVIAGATAIGIAALVFHKPTRNAVGLSDRVRNKKTRKIARIYYANNQTQYIDLGRYTLARFKKIFKVGAIVPGMNTKIKSVRFLNPEQIERMNVKL